MPISKGDSHHPEIYQGTRKVSISNFVSSRFSEKQEKCSHDHDQGGSLFGEPEVSQIRHEKRYHLPKQDFKKVLQKSEALAKIFGGQCISQNSFSNCKGMNSIRFNCQNGHNFYLTED
jgi:hypothetical protein